MLLVAFSRWRVERCFEDQKSEIGLDQYEGRRYVGLKRHLILSCVSYLFLSRVRQEFGGKNPELTECQVHTAVAALIPFWWLDLRPPRKLLERTSAEIERAHSATLSRRCHTKRTRRRLHALGIKLTEVPRCKWGATYAVVLVLPPIQVRRFPTCGVLGETKMARYVSILLLACSISSAYGSSLQDPTGSSTRGTPVSIQIPCNSGRSLERCRKATS